MLIEDLIKELEKFPKGTQVCLFDWRKNLHDDYGDGGNSGIYEDFSLSLEKLEGDELEFYKEQNDKEFIPWISITFDSDDYNDEGECLLDNI